MVSCWRLVIPNIRRVTCLFAVQLEIYSAWWSWWAVCSCSKFQFVNSSFVSICIDWSTADLSIEFQLTKSLCLSITKLFQRTTTLTCFAMSNFHGQDMCLFVCDVQISLVNSSPYSNLPCCDKRCDLKSKPIQLPPSSNSWPTSWIGDEAAMAVPCFGKHPSIPAYSTNFIFQFPMVQLSTSLHLAYRYFSTLTTQPLEISFVFHRYLS